MEKMFISDLQTTSTRRWQRKITAQPDIPTRDSHLSSDSALLIAGPSKLSESIVGSSASPFTKARYYSCTALICWATVPSSPNKASSSSLRKIIRSSAASANIARLVLSSIDMFRNVSVPVWAATSKHSYCGWLRLLFWFPPPLLLLLLLLILLLVDVHISPFTRVRTLNSLSQPRLRATAFGWEASPKAPHLVALVLYFC